MLRARESSRWLADVDQKRIDNLVKRGSAAQSELDERNNTLKVAIDQEKEAWAARVFWIFAIMALADLPLILIMKKSAARGGLAVH